VPKPVCYSFSEEELGFADSQDVQSSIQYALPSCRWILFVLPAADRLTVQAAPMGIIRQFEAKKQDRLQWILEIKNGGG